MVVFTHNLLERNQMFSCEMCGEGLAVNQVLAVDLLNYELCDDCVEILRESNQVITSSRFEGLVK